MLTSGTVVWAGVGGLGTRSAGSVQGGNVGYVVNDDGSITVGFAAYGDTNLDGTIDLLDLSNFIASGRFDKGTVSGWVSYNRKSCSVEGKEKGVFSRICG